MGLLKKLFTPKACKYKGPDVVAVAQGASETFDGRDEPSKSDGTEGVTFGMIGKRNDFDSIHSTTTATQWFNAGGSSDVRKRETVSLDVPESCGFDFDCVRLQSSSLLEEETGEVISEDNIVLMSGYNLVKVYSDWSKLLPEVNRLVSETWDGWDNRFVTETYRILCGREQCDSHGDDGRFVSAVLTVEDLTPTGRIKKFPIMATVFISWMTIGGKVHVPGDYDYDFGKDECTHMLMLRGHYLPDGTIGKGTISYGTYGTGIIAATFRTSIKETFVSKVEMNGEKVA